MEGVYVDVMDGNVWKKWESEGYFNQPSETTTNGEKIHTLSLAFMLNVDGFNPFEKRTRANVTASWLVCLNLPRGKRYRLEWVVPSSIFPGRKEAKQQWHYLLRLVVDEFLVLNKGILMTTKDNVKYRVFGRLLMVNCDLKAVRKVMGFVTCTEACSWCKKCFKRQTMQIKKRDKKTREVMVDEKTKVPIMMTHNKVLYNDFKNDFNKDGKCLLPGRSREAHMKWGKKWFAANNSADRKTIRQQKGYRWTPLLELPYFHPTRMCPFDPMHMLWENDCILTTYKSENILTDSLMNKLQQKVYQLKLPQHMSSMRGKINTLSGFTADEMKYFVTMLSQHLFEGILPDEHYRIWNDWAEGSRAISKNIVTTEDLVKAQKHLVAFLFAWEDMWGPAEHGASNFHYTLHLVSCIQDFGPCSAFQTFATERLAGEMGSFKCNPRKPNITFFRDIHRLKQLSQMQRAKVFGWDEQSTTQMKLLSAAGAELGNSNTSFLKKQRTLPVDEVTLKWYRYVYDMNLNIDAERQSASDVVGSESLAPGDGPIGCVANFFQVCRATKPFKASCMIQTYVITLHAFMGTS